MRGLRSRFRPLYAAGLAALSLMFAQQAVACCYDDPDQVEMLRSGLNLAYPDALHVVGALSSAQLAGIVASGAASTAETERLSDAQALRDFGAVLPREGNSAQKFSVSLVLIESMRWVRYLQQDGKLALVADLNGPQQGDTVMVTTAAALQQIAGRRMTLARAEELGLLRTYENAPALQ